MSRTERIVVRFAVVLSTFVLPAVVMWWAAAAIGMTIAPGLSENLIRAAAATGFGIGILLVVVRSQTWVNRFYTVNVTFMLLLYLAWSAVATTFLMGLPLGNLATGVAAGFYVGRRQYHARETRDVLRARARAIGLVTVAVTGIWALLIGIMALREEVVADVLRAALGMSPAALAGWPGTALVLVASAVLCLFQFWSTVAAARIAYDSGGRIVVPER